MQSVLRMIVGFMFIQHGGQKIFNFPPSAHPQAFSIATMSGVAGALEFVGGALIILGLLTRPAAFILSGEMAVAYFMVHAPKGFWPVVNQGESAVFYCFAFLYFSVAGAGSWSLDALIRPLFVHTKPPVAPGIDTRHPVSG